MSVNAPLGTVAAVLEVARRNIGFVEGPKNNQNPYAPFVGHANYQPWCASFVAAVMKRAGVPLRSTSAYTPTMANGFKADGRWGSTPKVGAVVFFQWPSMGRIAHVGIVETVNRDGSIVAIEGNTDSRGGRTGGRVMRQARKANIAGYGYPAYVAPPKPKPSGVIPGSRTLRRTNPPMKGEDVTYLQKYFHTLGNKALPITGVYDQPTADVATVFKRNRAITEPGFGKQSWSAVLNKTPVKKT